MLNDLVDLSLVYADQNPSILAVQLLTAILLSFAVRYYYMKFAAPMGNLGNIGNVLPVLSLVTFLVIVVVKTSLALSLGLVGALSIVRFRAPIKEPMELAFIFIAIAIGLGTGAGKHYITTVVVLIILIVDFLRCQFSKSELHGKTLLIDIATPEGVQSVVKVLALLNEVVGTVRLSRLELANDSLTLVAQLEVISQSDVNSILEKVIALDSNAKCTFFDNKPVW